MIEAQRSPSGLQGSSVDLDALRILCLNSETASKILNHCSAAMNRKSEATLDRLCEVLTQIPRKEIIEVLRKLASVGCGDFRSGRRGQPSRFEWKTDVSWTSIAEDVTGETPKVENISQGGISHKPDETSKVESGPSGQVAPSEINDMMVNHSFPLRLGLRLDLRLPSDLTKTEAARLSQYIQALPIE